MGEKVGKGLGKNLNMEKKAEKFRTVVYGWSKPEAIQLRKGKKYRKSEAGDSEGK